MADRMHPPGSAQHGVAIVIAAHPSDGAGRMKPPGTKPNDPMTPPDAAPDDTEQKDADGKVSPDAAQVIRADQHCGDCKNYDATSGDCSKVSGSFDPDDACLKYFEAMSESDEPDTDDQGGAPDADADDQGAPPTAQ